MPEPTSATQPNTTPELTGFAKDVSGDWKTAEQRFHDATHMARTAQAQAAQFQAELEQVRSQLSQPRPQPTAYLASVAEQLGVQPEHLAGALAEIAAPMLRQAISPITDSIVARQRLATEAPEFIKHESDIFAWAATQPQLINEVNRAIQTPGMATLAQKFLFREWQAANPPANAVQTSGAPASAGLPPLGGGGSPVQQQQIANNEQDAQAFLGRLQRAMRSHDGREVAGDLFKNTNWIGHPGLPS